MKKNVIAIEIILGQNHKMKIKNINKLREKLAELEHLQWSFWAKSLMQKNEVSMFTMHRWKPNLCDYKDLPEEIKNMDRIWADKVLELMKKW